MMMTGTSVGWQFVTPTEAGFAADLAERFEIARQAGVLPNLHGVVAARGGLIFFERYLAGVDAARGRPLGVMRFGPDTLHDMRSVTKGIVGLLYGIAMAAGYVPEPQASLLDQFPEYPDLAGEPSRRLQSVHHALTMTLGTEWDETTIPYTDPRNSEIAMDNAPDPYRYALERPLACRPGEKFTYNGGATALLARLIAKGTGRTLAQFARESLFAPLEIEAFEWVCGPSRDASAASGLRITPRDLVRIGMMILNDGRWRDRQVVHKDWLAASFNPATPMPDRGYYGYHWYVGRMAMDDGQGGVRWEPMISARGNGGQRLFLVPRFDLIVAVTAGNYDAVEQWRPPQAVLRDVVLPALRAE